MSSNVETVNVKFDTLKLVVAVVVALATIAGFYIFSDQSFLLRVGGLMVGVALAVGITLQTEKGRNIWVFFQESQIEVRKVVWPTRQETLQTTLIVIVVVIVVAVILWLLDMFLGWSVRILMGQGG
jgi:preprotein translocase subunit SecE